MGIGGIWQWVVVLIVILLIFGTKRLRNLGGDLGHAVQGFRKSMKGGSEKNDKDETVARAHVEDVEAGSRDSSDDSGRS